MRLETRMMVAAAFAAVFVLLLTGCGGGSGTTSNPPAAGPGGSAGGGGNSGGGGGNGGGSGSTPVTFEYAYFSHKDSSTIDALKLGSDGSVTAVNGSPFTSQAPVTQLSRGGALLFTLGTASSGETVLQDFKIDPQTGALVVLSTLNYTLIPGFFGQATAMVVDSQGRFVTVGFTDGQNDWMAVFSVDASTGSLTPIAGSPYDNVASYATPPANLVLSPDQKTLYWTVSLGGPRGTPFNYFIESFARDPNSGALTPDVGNGYASDPKVEFGKLAVTSDGAFLLSLHNGVSVFSTAGEKLTAVPGSPFAINQPTAIVAHPLLPVVYIALADGNVTAYALQMGGALAPVAGSQQVSGGVQDLALTPSGLFLVAAARGSGNAIAFRVDKNTGALSSPVTTSIGAPAQQVVTR